ncbi:hypothetical protein ABK040_015330 [Willaertia magna]
MINNITSKEEKELLEFFQQFSMMPITKLSTFLEDGKVLLHSLNMLLVRWDQQPITISENNSEENIKHFVSISKLYDLITFEFKRSDFYFYFESRIIPNIYQFMNRFKFYLNQQLTFNDNYNNNQLLQNNEIINNNTANQSLFNNSINNNKVVNSPEKKNSPSPSTTTLNKEEEQNNPFKKLVRKRESINNSNNNSNLFQLTTSSQPNLQNNINETLKGNELITGTFLNANTQKVVSTFETSNQDFLRKGFYQFTTTSQYIFYNVLKLTKEDIQVEQQLINKNSKKTFEEIDMSVIFSIFKKKCQMSKKFSILLIRVRDIRNKWAHFQYRKGIVDVNLVMECLEDIKTLTEECLQYVLNKGNNNINEYSEHLKFMEKRIISIQHLISSFKEFIKKQENREIMKMRFYENFNFSQQLKNEDEQQLNENLQNYEKCKEITIYSLQKLLEKLQNNNEKDKKNNENLINYFLLDIIPQSPYLFKEINLLYKEKETLIIEEIKLEIQKIITMSRNVKNQSNVAYDIRLKEFIWFFWFIILNIENERRNEYLDLFNSFTIATIHLKIFKNNNEFKDEIYKEISKIFNISNNVIDLAKELVISNFNNVKLKLLFEQYNEFRRYYRVLYKGYENLANLNYLESIKCFIYCIEFLQKTTLFTFPKLKESLWADTVTYHFQATIFLFGRSILMKERMDDNDVQLFINYCVKPIVKFNLVQCKTSLQSLLIKEIKVNTFENFNLLQYFMQNQTYEHVPSGINNLEISYEDVIPTDNLTDEEYGVLTENGSLFYYSACEVVQQN